MRETTGMGMRQTIRRFVGLMAILSVLLLSSCDFFGSLLGIDDYEPNDSIAEAQPIELGESYSAHIGEDDADFFSFRPAHGADTYDAVEISVTDVGADLRIGFALYDPQGNRVDSRTVNTKGADFAYTLRTPGLAAGDSYYIRFSGTWGVTGWEVDGIGDYDTQGPYTFRVRNLDANDDFAPNHTIDTAHAINLGQSYDGVLVSKYEADYFSFTPTAPTMTLSVAETGSALYLGVAWYDPDRAYIGKTTFETTGQTGDITLIGLTVGETHYVRFSGTDSWTGWEVNGLYDHESRGPYTFSVAN